MAILTLNKRMIFLADVAENLLNAQGCAKFYSVFYWLTDPTENITHSILDHTEKNLAEMIQKDEYRK